jgi:hypothetical protein
MTVNGAEHLHREQKEVFTSELKVSHRAVNDSAGQKHHSLLVGIFP